MVIIDYYIHRYTHIDTVCEHGHCINFEIDFYIWKMYNAGAGRGQSLLGIFSLMFYNSYTQKLCLKGRKKREHICYLPVHLKHQSQYASRIKIPNFLCVSVSVQVFCPCFLFLIGILFFNFMLNLFLSLWNFYSNFKICYFDLFIYCSNMYYFT